MAVQNQKVIFLKIMYVLTHPPTEQVNIQEFSPTIHQDKSYKG